ncbi:MAG: hypothetical protein ABSA65_04105 [Acidimicrobiales bacterium]|jgi:hypothetical protein
MNANQEPGREDAGTTTGAEASPPTPRNRRRALLVTVAAIVVLAVTVVSDLPVHSSLAADVSAGQSVMSEVNADVGPCAFAVKESFSIHADQVAGSLSSSDQREAPSLLRDDLAACSFTDDSIFELSNIEVPGSAAGKRLGDVIDTVTLWATSDALGAISDLETLLARPYDQTAQHDLVIREQALASDRAAAFADISVADQIISARLTEPALPVLPHSAVHTS